MFDFNGVLVDDEPIHCELFRRVLEEVGLSLDEAEYSRDYLGFDDAAAFRHAFRRAGRTVETSDLARLVTRKASYYQQRIREQSYPFFPGAVDLVGSASRSGLHLGVVSGALHAEVEAALRQAHLLERFKTLITAEDVSRSKPDPEGYRKGIEELNSVPPPLERLLHPHEVLAIEDTTAGIAAARAAGLVTLGLAHTCPRDALALADLVASSIDEVSVEWLQEAYAEASRA